MRGEKDKIIWANVERIRATNGWTLATLAGKMGVSPQQITGLKRRGIGARSIAKLASALGVTEEQLLVNSGKEQPLKGGTPEVEYLKKRIEDLEADKKALLDVIRSLGGIKEGVTIEKRRSGSV